LHGGDRGVELSYTLATWAWRSVEIPYTQLQVISSQSKAQLH
jgi:hypothetical protein